MKRHRTQDEPHASAEAPAATLTAVELLERAVTVRTFHPAQDVADGTLWYGVPVDGALALITSKREALRTSDLPAGIALRHSDPGPSTVTPDVALRWVTKQASGSAARTLDALAEYYARHVILPDRRAALWLSAWTLGTWCYRAFRVYPYLSIRSAEKRCGKSRLLGLLARVCFNASPVTAHPTEAQLYRRAAHTGGAQLFDEVETLRGDGKRFDALITVLNVGFERGGVVTRLEHRGDRYVEEPHEVFAPRVLAGIEGLKETLEDRSLSLFLLRKCRAEPVVRIGRATDAEAQHLREQCALACLASIGAIAAAYDRAPAMLERERIDDRAVDLWSPLVALAIVADAEDRGHRTRELLATARQLGALRDADADGGSTSLLLATLESVRTKLGETPTPGELLTEVSQRPGWERVKTPRALATLLNPLGIVRRQLWNRGQRQWAYVLNRKQLADLAARYASPDSPGTDASGDGVVEPSVKNGSAPHRALKGGNGSRLRRSGRGHRG